MTDPAPSSAGLKYDQDKPRTDLLPTEPLIDIAKVLAFGAKKYTENSWQKVETKRYYGAALRHLFAWKQGEVNDPESGLPHLAHAACCLLFMQWQEGHK
jgi:hypothetical protein